MVFRIQRPLAKNGLARKRARGRTAYCRACAHGGTGPAGCGACGACDGACVACAQGWAGGCTVGWGAAGVGACVGGGGGWNCGAAGCCWTPVSSLMLLTALTSFDGSYCPVESVRTATRIFRGIP